MRYQQEQGEIVDHVLGAKVPARALNTSDGNPMRPIRAG